VSIPAGEAAFKIKKTRVFGKNAKKRRGVLELRAPLRNQNAQGIEAVSFLPQAKKYKRKARSGR
jgi:hypothetical protein